MQLCAPPCSQAGVSRKSQSLLYCWASGLIFLLHPSLPPFSQMVVRDLTRAMGGDLTVRSPLSGVGVEYVATLRLEDVILLDAAGPAGGSAQQGAGGPGGIRGILKMRPGASGDSGLALDGPAGAVEVRRADGSRLSAVFSDRRLLALVGEDDPAGERRTKTTFDLAGVRPTAC